MHTTAHPARTMWPAFETIHATVYFAPEAPEAYKALGLKGGWMGYFATRATLQENRKWNDDEWAAAEARLRERGWLDTGGNLTEAGRAHHQQVEDTTDALAAAPWDHLGPERTGRLLDLLTPLARAIAERGGVPVPNPVGVPAP